MPSHDQRRAELIARREARRAARERHDRLRRHLAEEATRRDERRRGLPVDFAALRPNGSYTVRDFVARGYYLDLPFVCHHCGTPEVWTAAQQKWWYEVARGRTSTGPGGCRACRQAARAARLRAQEPREPDPYKTPGQVLAHVVAGLGPTLRAAGWARLKLRGDRPRRLHQVAFERGRDLLAISLDRSRHRLAAEALAGDGADLRELAAVDFPLGLPPDMAAARVAAFVAAFVAAGLPAPAASGPG